MELPRIDANPKVMAGKPVIKGTRITVEYVPRMLGSNHSIEELIEAYPDLTAEDARAAQTFAADYLADERIIAAE